MEKEIPEHVTARDEARNVVMRQRKSRWRFVAAGFFAALVGLIVWDGADRKAADATRPIMMSPNVAIERSRPQTLKLASWRVYMKRSIREALVILFDAPRVVYRYLPRGRLPCDMHAGSERKRCEFCWSRRGVILTWF